jgi:hypothetical protein
MNKQDRIATGCAIFLAALIIFTSLALMALAILEI